LALLLAALLLGLWQPAPLAEMLAASARLTGGF
jgi:alkanesulfonate monooxygenase SsuD/methylene tetrahydromethanopterin reductase-like flavin-dependent oxidoreductase (luciferase family)